MLPARIRPLPFWLLIAAWLCANTPDIVLWRAATWLETGRTFGHQSRLHSELAVMLGTTSAPLARTDSWRTAAPTDRETPCAAAAPRPETKQHLAIALAPTPIPPPPPEARGWRSAPARVGPSPARAVPLRPPRTA